MRISAVLCTIALLAAQSVATFADSHMGGSGFYGSIGGGAVLVGDSKKVKAKGKVSIENVEVEVTVDGAESDWAYDFGYTFGGAVGYDFGDFRVDVEVGYLSVGGDLTLAGVKDDKADNLTLAVVAGTANAWYDIDTGTPFTPYVGAGAGGANVSATIKDTPEYKGTGWAFAYLGGAGVTYAITPQIEIDLGYRLLGALGVEVKHANYVPDLDVSFTPSIMTHRLALGVRFAF